MLESAFLHKTELNIFMEFMLGFSSDSGFQCISNSGVTRHPEIRGTGRGGGTQIFGYND